jgi:hypothetical protein
VAEDVQRADHLHARPWVDTLVNTLERRPGRRRGGLLMVDPVLIDARYAIRKLRQAPGFAVVAVLILALGIGATTAIFSVVNGVLLRPLPYPHSEELVRVHKVIPQFGLAAVAPADFLDGRALNPPRSPRCHSSDSGTQRTNNSLEGDNLRTWLGGRDSNPDNVVQSHVNVLRCALVCSGWLWFSRPALRFALVRSGLLSCAPVQRVSLCLTL